MKKYKNIIVGAGAAGLYCACFLDGSNNLILEKGKRPGLKLLMAGSGQCNVTHGGSIKDFLELYGENGKRIRGVLQRHNNMELCQFLTEVGVPIYEREDGKVFPKSMNGRDVLNALLEKANAQIKYQSEVIRVSVLEGEAGYVVKTKDGDFLCDNLIIATGGASYPTTGSDGKLAKTISVDLNLEMEELRPALTPVFVENYSYGDLSGISFKDIKITIGDTAIKNQKSAVGDLLFTLKNFSGPVIINSSRYMKTGDDLTINFLWPRTSTELVGKMKKDFPGNNKLVQHYLIDELGLVKRFAKLVAESMGVDNQKVSQLSGNQIKALATELCDKTFKISGLAGFKEAMATAGGISLGEVSTKTLEAKSCSGLYFIGEVLDVDGDTGGYNLQFAYSSARACADHINTKQD